MVKLYLVKTQARALHSFELREERRGRRRRRSLWGRGEGWQATLEAFLGGGGGALG
jgi:hypothetical protein